MIIQKFGGTSMGSARSICECVAPIVEKAVAEKRTPVVVVSAMSGVTTQLLEAAQLAASKRSVADNLLGEIRQRHLTVICGLQGSAQVKERASKAINADLDELGALLKALTVVGDLSARSHDAILAVGEKLSAQLMTCVLMLRGIEAEYVNLEAIFPDNQPYSLELKPALIEHYFKQRFADTRPGVTPVLTGFFGSCGAGMLKVVGRGYSDYCASLVGAALGANEIQIWTDVDGVLSANPKVVPAAFLLNQLSFNETAELAHFGAKVLHPHSVRPAVRAGIPLRVLNTFNPNCPGTVITQDSESLRLPLKSITAKKGVTIVRIATPLMLFAYGYLERIAGVFARNCLSVDLVTTSEVSVSFSIDVPLPAESPVLTELATLGEVFIRHNQAIISLVGVELGQDPLVLSKVFTVLAEAGIAVRMVSLSDARINLSLVLDEQESDHAVKILHTKLFAER